MIYDLSILSYEEEIVEQLKMQHRKLITERCASFDFSNIDTNDTVMLYHGTSINNLNGILLNGILSRENVDISNFSGNIESNENLIYLTNKWHYFYAYNAYINSSKSGDDYFSLPCYVEAKVPKDLLVEEEDFFHSHYMINKIKRCIRKQERYLEVTWKESLAQYGTVAVLGDLDRKYLISFTIIADMPLFHKNFISPNSQYQQELAKWAGGKGKGKLKFIGLVELERA